MNKFSDQQVLAWLLNNNCSLGQYDDGGAYCQYHLFLLGGQNPCYDAPTVREAVEIAMEKHP